MPNVYDQRNGYLNPDHIEVTEFDYLNPALIEVAEIDPTEMLAALCADAWAR